VVASQERPPLYIFLGRVEDEVVTDFGRLPAVKAGWVENELRLHSACDIVSDVLVTFEVELSRDELVAGRRYLEVKVGGAPRVPSRSVDELTTSTLGRNLVWSGLNGVDLEVSLFISNDGSAKIPLRKPRSILRIEAKVVCVP